VRNWSIKSLVAIGIAGAAAMHTVTPLYAQILSSREVMEQVGSSDLTATDTFLVLGVLSGKATATPGILKQGCWRAPIRRWYLHHAGWCGTEQ
jgi:hypothetical protein